MVQDVANSLLITVYRLIGTNKHTEGIRHADGFSPPLELLM